MPKQEVPRKALSDAFEKADGLDGSIDEKLASYAEASKTLIPEVAAVYARFIERLASGDAGSDAPKTGDEMPDFLLPDREGRLVSLSTLLEAGPVVVSFNRGHWCPYCRLELRALSRAHSAITAAGATLVSIVPEKAEFAAAMTERNALPFKVLCDIDHGYALAVGLVVWTGPEIKATYAELGVTLPKYQGNDSWFLSIPATFVVGQNGKVKARLANPDFRRRLSIPDILAALQG